MIFSPDFKFLYLLNEDNSEVINIYNVDNDTGLLTFVDDEQLAYPAYTGDISPDGKFLYTANEDLNWSGWKTIEVHERDLITGLTTTVKSYSDDLYPIGIIEEHFSIDISPDGNYLFSASGNNNALIVLKRNLQSGEIQYLEHHKDGTNGVAGLNDVRDVIISPYGKHVYTAAVGSNSISVFGNNLKGQKGLYVDNFKNIIGVEKSEIELLSFAASNNIKSLTLYDLNEILPLKENELSAFIVKAKSLYAINEIGAAGSNQNQFDKIISFNNNQTYNGKFDSLTTEYEFWHDGTFEAFIGLLDYINSNCDLKIEVYIGNFEQGNEASQALELVSRVDRLFLHCYVSDPQYAFEYGEERLGWLGYAANFIGKTLDVRPIFSAEYRRPDLWYMGCWLTSHDLIEAENEFLSDYNANTDNWKNNIDITGFQYFAYSYLKHPTCSKFEISTIMQLLFNE
jgi:DNA-binding beta-propeller fold protein YncE